MMALVLAFGPASPLRYLLVDGSGNFAGSPGQ